MATGGAHAPVKDALSRPITAGGLVDGASVIFLDITKQSGLDKFRHRSGRPEKSTIIDAPGSGVGLIDYDNDGWLDIYLLNGSTVTAIKGSERPPRAMLFHNNHDGTFTDVTEKAGVANERWGFGVAVADYDNDGWPDIYVANYGRNRLYHNNHDGTFTDVAERAGVTLGGWSTGPTWGDYDHDGLLDLFVPGYVNYNVDRPIFAGKNGVPEGACQYRGVPVFCGPVGLIGESDHLFHNNGDGTFADVSLKAGVADREGRYGFASLFADLDDDGWLDLVVANDSTPNYLYRNRRDGTFEDLSYESGFAVNGEGRAQASMGIGVGDYNRDGQLDLFITTFSDDYKTLYRNDGGANFTDVSFRAGLGNPTIPFLAWGAGFLDFDNDGLLDIFIANGHIDPEIQKVQANVKYAMPPHLFRNLGKGKFEEVTNSMGPAFTTPRVGRGAAYADINNDGRLDLLLSTNGGPTYLFRNDVQANSAANRSVRLKLVGTKSNRDGIGAVVRLTSGGDTQTQMLRSGSSYLSSSELILTFGLGQRDKAETIEVHWPSGQVDRLSNVAA